MTFAKLGQTIIETIEYVVTLFIFIGISLYTVNSFLVLVQLDWGSSAAFQELIERALLLLVGVEIIQVLRLHEVRDVFLIGIFVLSRKALDPSTTTYDVILLVVVIITTLSTWGVLTAKGLLNPRSPI